MFIRLLLFLLLNFGALAIGGFFTGTGVASDWYTNLTKAPWTPPGWVFGAAWTIIMVCFSVYMALLFPKVENTSKLLVLFGLQWLLNFLWNPVFFYFHFTLLGFVIIAALTILVFVLLFLFWNKLAYWSLLIAPYALWLLIATSLNGYILLKN